LDATAGEPLRAAALHHRPALGRDRRSLETFETRLESLFRAIAYGDWVPGYLHGRGVAERLGGVRRRVALPPVPADEAPRLARALDSLLDHADHCLPQLLAARPAAITSSPESRPRYGSIHNRPQTGRGSIRSNPSTGSKSRS
ncbi:MAG: hypothetical protein MI919_21765, partial [Holophagales bacterium]|nr:hypothetical protein [Holophagales bacterium]